MIFLLRTSLSRNLGDMGNPELYTKSRVGTKRLIEDYIDEVVKQLIYICDSPDTADNTLDNKLDFFRNTRQYFGRTALLLSGGATLGLNHVGVIKALHECHLLPRIISGSSVGSIIAALVCSKTDSELFDFLHVRLLSYNYNCLTYIIAYCLLCVCLCLCVNRMNQLNSTHSNPPKKRGNCFIKYPVW
jgi:hypothetical protein